MHLQRRKKNIICANFRLLCLLTEQLNTAKQLIATTKNKKLMPLGSVLVILISFASVKDHSIYSNAHMPW